MMSDEVFNRKTPFKQQLSFEPVKGTPKKPSRTLSLAEQRKSLMNSDVNEQKAVEKAKLVQEEVQKLRDSDSDEENEVIPPHPDLQQKDKKERKRDKKKKEKEEKQKQQIECSGPSEDDVETIQPPKKKKKVESDTILIPVSKDDTNLVHLCPMCGYFNTVKYTVMHHMAESHTI